MKNISDSEVQKLVDEYIKSSINGTTSIVAVSAIIIIGLFLALIVVKNNLIKNNLRKKLLNDKRVLIGLPVIVILISIATIFITKNIQKSDDWFITKAKVERVVVVGNNKHKKIKKALFVEGYKKKVTITGDDSWKFDKGDNVYIVVYKNKYIIKAYTGDHVYYGKKLRGEN